MKKTAATLKTMHELIVQFQRTYCLEDDLEFELTHYKKQYLGLRLKVRDCAFILTVQTNPNLKVKLKS